MPRLAAKSKTILLAAVLSSALAAPLHAQIPPLLSGQSQKPPASVPQDPLGRGTPHGTIVGFLRAAQDERNAIAVQYFQQVRTRRHPSEEQEEELAQQLLAVLNQKFAPFLDSVSNDPQGRLDDGLAPDEEKIGAFRGDPQTFELILVRQEEPHGDQLWYISRQTLDQVPAVYYSLQYPQIEKILPKFLVQDRFLAMPLWQWIAILIAIPMALGLGWLFTWIAHQGVKGYRRSRGLPPLTEAEGSGFGPGTLLLALVFHYTAVIFIGASLLYRQYYQRVILVLLILGLFWAVTRTTRVLARVITNRMVARGRYAERSVVSLFRRIVNVMVLIFLILVALQTMGVNVTAALAGLGIGGFAVGLGAQKTFENLLGGISILSDRALQIGDVCKIGDQTGVVEDIGLRSTKLRTADRTLVSIPNGTVATATLENYRWRDKILSKQIVRLRYDISPQHLAYLLARMREIVQNDPKVETSSARVRLLRFADFAFEVEIFAYILERDYNNFLAAQENLLLRITTAIEDSGSSIASSQNIVYAGDQWKRPEKFQPSASGESAPSVSTATSGDSGQPKPRENAATAGSPDRQPPRRS
jgi:MscS family membrane protein